MANQFDTGQGPLRGGVGLESHRNCCEGRRSSRSYLLSTPFFVYLSPPIYTEIAKRVTTHHAAQEDEHPLNYSSFHEKFTGANHDAVWSIKDPG